MVLNWGVTGLEKPFQSKHFDDSMVDVGKQGGDEMDLGVFWSLPRGVSPRLEWGMQVHFPPEL